MASDLLTVAEVKEHITTGLSDAALERLIDAQDAYIRRMVGEHDPETTMVYEDDHQALQSIWLPRPATAITSVEERRADQISEWEVRASSSYRLTNQGRAIESIFRRFYEFVRVTFTPVPQNAERTQALIDLVRLETQDTGLQSERDDTYAYQAKNKTLARRQVIALLRPGYRGLA